MYDNIAEDLRIQHKQTTMARLWDVLSWMTFGGFIVELWQHL